MKYLFFIHSQITLLVARLIIEQEHIRRSDAVFLLSRGVQLEDNEIATFDFPFAKNTDSIPQTRNLLACLKTLKQFDAFLLRVTEGNQFICYVPQNSIRALELMINSKRCKGFCIMEEGAASYSKLEDLNREYGSLRRSFWDQVGYLGRIGRRFFYRPDYIKVYGITPEAFPGFRDKVFLSTQLLQRTDSQKMNNKTVLIYDDIIISDILIKSRVLSEIASFLKSYNNAGELYYKFHPMHSEAEKQSIRELMKEQISLDLIELENNFSIEMLAASARDLTFIVNLSSLGLYASFFGHKVFSFAELLKEYPVDRELLYGKTITYGDFIRSMPEPFLKKVTFLQKFACL